MSDQQNLYRQIEDVCIDGFEIIKLLAEFIHEFAPEKAKEITYRQAALFIKKWDDDYKGSIRKQYSDIRDELKKRP
jgi:hypothetical protein